MEQASIVEKGDDMKIAYKIAAVPERLRNAMVEAQMLGIGSDSVYIDKDHIGSVWNKFRIYEDAIADSSLTHICMSDDDIVIPQGFREGVEQLVKRFPNNVFCFYNSKVGGETPCIYRLMNHYMNGTSCVIPINVVPDFLKFYHANLEGFKWDDTSFSMYALLNDIDVMIPVPKFVNTIHVESSLPMRRGRFQPSNAGNCYHGSINVHEIANAPIMSVWNGMMHTHLSKTHPINILCEKKWRKLHESNIS